MTLYLLVCVFLAIFLGGAFYAYRIAFYSPMEGRDKIPTVSGPNYDIHREEISRIYRLLRDCPFETVSTSSREGLTLSARYYHVRDNAPVAICFHGYRSSCMTDFCGGAELCREMGQNILLVDQRAHGKSEGRTITFGIRERQDLMCWIDYVLEHFGSDTKILLYGVSMGGATVLMASELDLPKNVKAIVADCPYASPMEIILHVGKTTPFPRPLIKPFIILGAKIFGGFDIRETDARRAVRQAKVPILINHGEEDGYVPCEMSDIAAENPAMIVRYTFPNADHGISYVVDRPRYRKIVMDFMQQVL